MPNKKRIVVLDDDLVSAKLIYFMFEDEYDILYFIDAQKGLDWISSNYNSVNLLICDLIMPDISGLDVLKIIKGKNYKFPIIFISGDTDEEHKQICYELGAYDYILKPFICDDLKEKIQKALDDK